MDLRILHLLSCKKRSWSHLCFSGQHYENIFQALHKNFKCHYPPLFGWVKMSDNTNLCHHFHNKVAGRGTLAKNDRNGGFELKIAWNGGFLTPLMTPTVRYTVEPPLTDTSIQRTPPNNGQIFSSQNTL